MPAALLLGDCTAVSHAAAGSRLCSTAGGRAPRSRAVRQRGTCAFFPPAAAPPSHFNASTWAADAAGILQQLHQPPGTPPAQLWEALRDTEQLQHHRLDLASLRLLLDAAAATCASQQQYNCAAPLLLAAAQPLLPEFGLADYRVLLRLCAAARHVPDKESLAALYYGDSGGLERLYAQESPAALVLLLADLAAMLGSLGALVEAVQQQHQQQQQQQQDSDDGSAAAEAAAVQAALQLSSSNLLAIQADPLLAGELNAVGGYWLLRRLLPAVPEPEQPAALLTGLCALPCLGFKVLDSQDADVLLARLTAGLPAWSSSQLAAATVAALPCLGETPPLDGQQLGELFAALGAAAPGMASREAGRVLVALSSLPGYAPHPQVAQALLNRALHSPAAVEALTARQLYALLTATGEVGVAPSEEQLESVQQVLSRSS